MIIRRFLHGAVQSLTASRKQKRGREGNDVPSPAPSHSGHFIYVPRDEKQAAPPSFLTRRLIWITGGEIRNSENGLTSDLASTRYRVLQPGLALEKRGWRSEFVVEGAAQSNGGWGQTIAPCSGDTVIVSKVFSDYAVALAEDAKARGAKLIVDICDNYLDIFASPEFQRLNEAGRQNAAVRHRVQKALLEMTDGVVVSSEPMANLLESYGRRPDAVIYDPVEMPKGRVDFSPDVTLRLLWYGHAMNLYSLESLLPQLADYAKKQRLVLRVVSNLNVSKASIDRFVSPGLEVEYTPWSIRATRQALADCDIVVIPVIESQFKAAKSPNRLLEALWSGRFAVAGNLPVYRLFKDSAWVGDNLIEGLEWALSHPEEVRARIAKGQSAIEAHFTADAIGGDWEKVILELHGNTGAPDNQRLCFSDPRTEHRSKNECSGDAIRLNLGCGDKILPGYVNVDVVESRAGKKPDVLCDLRKLEPFADDTVDEILAVHVVEHFWRWEVLDVLREWARVLKPGGKMILECPNLISACESFLKEPKAAAGSGPEGQRSMWVFYGDPRWQDPYMVHRWGYTPQSLAKLMEEAGLVDARREPAQFKLREPRDMRVVAEKPADWAGKPSGASGSMSGFTAKEVNPIDLTASRVSHFPDKESDERQVWDDYLVWFYHANIWKRMTWRGVRTLKLPSDMWNYQEIIHERKIDWVIEAGTRHGGSALFFAEALAARGAKGKVISIDIDSSAREIESHSGIDFMIGDSGSSEMVQKVAALLPDDRGPVFLILDSDHAQAHVMRELEAWVPFLRSGDYLVVEDGAINGHPVRPDFGPGPYEAVQQYLAACPGVLIRDDMRERKFGPTFAPSGYFVKK